MEIFLETLNDKGYLGIIVITFCALLYKYLPLILDFIKNKKKQSHIERRNDNMFEINKVLQTIADRIQCDRIAIFEFHNGGTNLTGMPFSHFSLTHLRGKLGIPEFNKNFENMQKASAVDFFAELRAHALWQINDVSVLEHSFPTLHKELVKEELQRVYIVSLEGVKDKIGFLIIAFKNTEDIDNVFTESEIIKDSQKISILLDLKNL